MTLIILSDRICEGLPTDEDLSPLPLLVALATTTTVLIHLPSELSEEPFDEYTQQIVTNKSLGDPTEEVPYRQDI